MGLGMMGRIQVTPGWANDTVWIHDNRQGMEVGGMSRYPPRADIRWQAEK